MTTTLAIALLVLAAGVYVVGRVWEVLRRRLAVALWVWVWLAVWAWIAVATGLSAVMDGDAARYEWLLPFVSISGLGAAVLTLLAGVGLARAWAELMAVRAAFPTVDGGERVGTFVEDGEALTVHVRWETRRGWRRWDGRSLLLRCSVAPEAIELPPARELGGLRVPGGLGRLVGTPVDPGMAGRVWLHEVSVGSQIRVHRGVVELRRTEWATRERLSGWVEEVRRVAQGLRRSAEGASARFASAATSATDPAARRQAWLDLDATDRAAVRSIAAHGVGDPDPVIRAVAAAAVDDAATMTTVLRASPEGDAVRRAAVWAERTGRAELAPELGARLGVPPAEAWLALVSALGALGGRAEMEVLHTVREGEGYGPALRQAAGAAMERIRARLGPGEAGRVALAGGGEVSVVGDAGAVSVAGEERRAR